MVDAAKTVVIDYTNHAGKRQIRTIIPHEEDNLVFGSSEWHPEPQWLLNAFDIGKAADRTFAVSSLHRWGTEPAREIHADLSLAKQLQNSMELNARMKNRMRRLLDAGVIYKDQIRDILDDKDPQV